MRIFLSTLAILLLGATLTLQAQDFSGIDIRTVNVDNLSDQQIRRIWEEADRRGLSVDQVGQLAVARGMPQSEASKLTQRLRQVRSGLGRGGEDEFVSGRMRTAPVDSARIRMFDRFFGVETTRDSLQLYQTLERIRYQTQRDSASLARQRLKDRIFGSELFTTQDLSFEPSLNIPTPKNYELGPGDELIIDIWGAAQNTYTLQITPDGMVMIPDLGPIYISGLTIEEATERLKNRLSQIYSGLKADVEGPIDTYMQVTLGQVRSIKVSLLGEVSRPGTYTLPSLATIFNALYSAGGPSVKGSYRKIQLIRNNRTIVNLDLYDFLVYGDQSDNIRLQDQDIIKINPYVNRVEIEGEVKREGIFETLEQETVSDLITFTGGFTGQAYEQRVKIIGSGDREQVIRDAPKERFDRIRLHNGDRVTVGKILDRFSNRVQIQGAVWREGEYELTDTTTLYSLIQRADGLRGDAFMNRGLIYRTLPDLTVEAIPFNVRELLNNPGLHDIKLVRDDVVRIQSIFDLREEFFVSITGAVQKPAQYEYVKDMTLESLIYQAGGFKLEAAPYRIEVARRISKDMEKVTTSRIARIYQFTVDDSLRLDPGEKDFVLQPFDRVYVFRAPNYFEQRDVKVGGEVLYPGSYSLQNKTDRISDILNRAGGLTEDAYLAGATLFRRVEELREVPTDPDQEQLEGFVSQAQLERQRRQTAITRIGINLPDILAEPGSKYDLILQEGDSLHIPKELQTVIVKGGVFQPTSVRFDSKKNFMDYVSAAGGLTRLGEKNRGYVVYANGEVDRTRKFLFFKNYPDVEPGAMVVIPEREERQRLSPQERISILSAIVSTAALVSTTIIQITR